jgi:hypothetical protein|tara:strand:+ start:11670 stop:11909 length:240 start_codon:yes stop_codon:yes gene_type:complete
VSRLVASQTVEGVVTSRVVLFTFQPRMLNASLLTTSWKLMYGLNAIAVKRWMDGMSSKVEKAMRSVFSLMAKSDVQFMK